MTDTSQQTPEKRRAVRVTPASERPVRIDLMGEGFIEVTSAVNVSKEGVGISVPHGFEGYNLDALTVILVNLPEPVNHSFSTTVKVIHQQGNNFGAQFEKLEKEDAEKLFSYIEHQLKKTDGAALLKMIYGE